ncbi:hypothetical protein MTR_2g023900 [Medicago truncatula]|uniref:Uncharacterized protein n=1 Tax=Medicago truncatula TaxID=3880 RepID=A0A072V6E6_MEDTR|nr:hypothetical protein MTR_2g023900 [Medicago truncatula]
MSTFLKNSIGTPCAIASMKIIQLRGIQFTSPLVHVNISLLTTDVTKSPSGIPLIEVSVNIIFVCHQRHFSLADEGSLRTMMTAAKVVCPCGQNVNDYF